MFRGNVTLSRGKGGKRVRKGEIKEVCFVCKEKCGGGGGGVGRGKKVYLEVSVGA